MLFPKGPPAAFDRRAAAAAAHPFDAAAIASTDKRKAKAKAYATIRLRKRATDRAGAERAPGQRYIVQPS